MPDNNDSGVVHIGTVVVFDLNNQTHVEAVRRMVAVPALTTLEYPHTLPLDMRFSVEDIRTWMVQNGWGQITPARIFNALINVDVVSFGKPNLNDEEVVLGELLQVAPEAFGPRTRKALQAFVASFGLRLGMDLGNWVASPRTKTL